MSTPLYDAPKVGGDALCFCTKCKMDLAHVIVSMVGTRPAKVQCKTCKSERRYRDSSNRSRSVAEILGTKPKRKVANTVAKMNEMWETKIAEAKGKGTRPYATSDVFATGDVIEHGQFGVGIVEVVKPNNKIDVLFRGEIKTLIHNLVRN